MPQEEVNASGALLITHTGSLPQSHIPAIQQSGVMMADCVDRNTTPAREVGQRTADRTLERVEGAVGMSRVVMRKGHYTISTWQCARPETLHHKLRRGEC